MKRWLRRAAGAGAIVVVLDIVLGLFDFAPDHLRLTLVVALGVAVTGLLLDSVGSTEGAPAWRVDPMGTGGATATDPHLASYVRILESHLTARTADSALRDRLKTLCDERLGRRHALTREDPGAETLLGPELLRELTGPPRRLRRDEIDGYLRRIEEL